MRREVGARKARRCEASCGMLIKNDNDAGEWSTMFRPFKTHPASQKMHNTVWHSEIMPPNRICPGRKKADHTISMALSYFYYCLEEPRAYRSAIRRIHPANAVPCLGKSILFRRKIPLALGIFRCGADIQGKGAM